MAARGPSRWHESPVSCGSPAWPMVRRGRVTIAAAASPWDRRLSEIECVAILDTTPAHLHFGTRPPTPRQAYQKLYSCIVYNAVQRSTMQNKLYSSAGEQREGPAECARVNETAGPGAGGCAARMAPWGACCMSDWVIHVT